MRVTCRADAELQDAMAVDLSGKLDARGALHLWDAVEGRVEEAPRGLLIDMSNVDFLSSAGIGILVRLLRRAVANGGTISLYDVEEKVLNILQVCDLAEVLNVCDSLKEARARLDAAGG